jgi:hypothetical protein
LEVAVPTRLQFREPDGGLRVWWFAAAIVAWFGLCLGLASIGGWPGIVIVAAAQLAVVAGVIVSADRAVAANRDRADGPAEQANGIGER